MVIRLLNHVWNHFNRYTNNRVSLMLHFRKSESIYFQPEKVFTLTLSISFIVNTALQLNRRAYSISTTTSKLNLFSSSNLTDLF